MPNPIPTAIGRVQPIFRGPYNSSTIYNRLDNVYYNGGTWVCLNNNITGVPAEGDNWHQVASQGDTGGIGIPTASAFPSNEASVAVSVDSSIPSAAVFHFEFGLPKGDTGEVGVATATATATTLPAGNNPSVQVGYDSALRNIDFTFGIPAADGSGIQSIDGNITADGSGNADLRAVTYKENQGLNSTQQGYARSNISAQIMGNYPALPTEYIPQNGQTLYYNNNEWTTKTINELPALSSADYGKFLKQTSNGAIWYSVQELPAGGSAGQFLQKSSNTDYSVSWGSVISSAEIDALFSTAGLT